MIKFILKGILRDRSRSLIPMAVIALGVGLTVLLSGYIGGVF
jgi:putative ABC transport system permease protein